jgi:hypothetical protein
MTGEDVSSLLDRGESLIWAGRPVPLRYARRENSIYRLLFGLVFSAISVGFMIGALKSSGDTSMWLAGMPFVVMGTFIALSPLWNFLEGRGTRYVLTDRRAIIDTGGLWKRRLSVPLTQVQFVELVEGMTGLGDVIFKEETVSGGEFVAIKRDGFVAIDDASDVERKFRDAIDACKRQTAA